MIPSNIRKLIQEENRAQDAKAYVDKYVHSFFPHTRSHVVCRSFVSTVHLFTRYLTFVYFLLTIESRKPLIWLNGRKIFRNERVPINVEQKRTYIRYHRYRFRFERICTKRKLNSSIAWSLRMFLSRPRIQIGGRSSSRTFDRCLRTSSSSSSFICCWIFILVWDAIETWSSHFHRINTRYRRFVLSKWYTYASWLRAHTYIY